MLNPKWAVGVITTPRNNGYYLDHTLCSLKNAGWSDIVIFAEPNSSIPEDFQGHVVHRRKQYGDWTNWATGFYELLLSNHEADLFLMSEDDALYQTDTMVRIEEAVTRLGEFASLSLYTPKKYHKPHYSGFHNECHDWETLSTVSVVMTKEMAISFFSSKMVQKHRFENILSDVGDINYGCVCDPKNSIKDAVIGRWASRLNLPIYYHTPSFVQHIGHDSTIASDAVEEKNLCAAEDHACLEKYVMRTDRSNRIPLL